MAQGGRNDPSQNANSEWTYLIGAIVIIGAAVFAWYLAHGWFVRIAFGLCWLELWAVKLTFGLSEKGNGALEVIQDTLMGRYDAWEIPFDIVRQVKTGAGEKVKWLFIPVILGFAVYCLKNMQGNGHTATLDMNAFANIQEKHWKTLTPGSRFKADNAPATWDQSQRPTDWLKANEISLKDSVIDEDKVREVLLTHLGEPWRGFTEELPVHVRALVTIFGMHHIGETTKVDGEKKLYSLILREEISVAYGTMPAGPELDAKVESLIAPFANHKRMKLAVGQFADPKKHAYRNTALFAQLLAARKQQGVLPTSEFLWLKGIDRTLWYVMNNCGRRAYLVEGGGAVAHYDAEKVSGKALIKPHLETALWGVKTYFQEHHIPDIEEFLKSEEPEIWARAS